MVMRLGDIDFRKKPVTPQLFLCKPNKEIISKMNEAYGITFNPKLGALNELTFTLPVFVDKRHEMERNENADKMRGRYLIKLVLGGYEEYFMVTQVGKNGKDDGEEFHITTLSLGFETNDKIIRDYKAVSLTATELLNELLVGTIWTIGYVDSEFDLKKRGLEISSNTVLECVFEVAKTFNALVTWDTHTRQISFRKPDLVGLEKGFKIKMGKYLESLNQEDNAEEIVTRMKMYGKEDLSIREINPTGTTYVEDFRYFMYPYTERYVYKNHPINADEVLSKWNYEAGIWVKEVKTVKVNGVDTSYTFVKETTNSTVNKIISNPSSLNLETYKVNGTFYMSNGDDDNIGIVFRYKDDKNYYYFGYDGGGYWGSSFPVRFYKVVNGVHTLLAQTSYAKWLSNKLYSITVEVVGDTFKATIDGTFVLTVKDSTHKNGAYGFYSLSQEFGVTNISVDLLEHEVVTKSDYMSDELCHAILVYNQLIEDKKADFTTLIAKRTELNNTLDEKQKQDDTANTELKILLDQRDVLNTRIAKMDDEVDAASNLGNDTTLLKSNLDSLKAERDAKLVEIEAKKVDVSKKEAGVIVAKADLQVVLDKINDLKKLISVEENFSPTLIAERNQYIIEKEWQDSNIDNAQDLLTEGMKVFEEARQQKITLKVDIVNFLSMITEQINWDKLGLGDTIVIEHERLGVAYKAKITEIEYNFEDASINVTISNVKDMANKDKFLDMLYKGYGSSTQISIDKWKWDLSMENKGSINQIINNFWDANKQAIIGAKDQVIEISDRGLIIRDPNDPSTYLVGLNGMIAITNDGGNTWKHAITGTGIVGERIYGKVIMGVNLAIEDEHGVVKWQGSLGEIFDRNGKLVMKMGLVDEEPDTFGLWSFNDITRVRMDDRVGFTIERANTDAITYPDGWEKVLWADPSNGTLYAHDLVAEEIKIVNNVGKTILDAENNYLDLGEFQNIVMDNKFSTIEKLQVITELYKIEAGYKRMLEQAEKYRTSDRDAVFDPSSQFFTKIPSTHDLYSTTPLTTAYTALLAYMETYIKITNKDPLAIAVDDPLTESTSDIPDRAEFILMFKNYYDAEKDLRNKIEDAQFYSGMNMGQFYNNIVIGDYGFIALRNDGKYRAFLNATNGMALQKWENNRWTNKVYASIGNNVYEDGTLIAEDLVAKRLRIETKDGGVLLDVDSLQLDFSVLDYIILDDVIMSPEKITLSNQYKSITKQYNELKTQITKYATTIYSDRDSSYTGLNTAKDLLVQAGADLTNAFEALVSYMTPIFADMNAKTHIVDDLHSTRQIFHSKWEEFYKAYEMGRSRLADFLEKSSLQLGRNYNNTVIDAQNGIVVTRGNMMNRTTLNATEGIKIEQNLGSASSPSWVKRFYVGLDGKLYAEELQAKALKILDGTLGTAILFDATDGITINGKHGEVIRLNANEGISINVNNDKRLWIGTDGTLRAKRLIIDSEEEAVKLPDGSFISQLTVNAVRTLSNLNPRDYVYVKDNYVKLFTLDPSGTAPEEKMSIHLQPNGSTAYNGYPVIKMGAGSSTTFADNEVGYIIKDADAWKFNYKAMNGNQRRLWFNRTGSEGILMESIGNMLRLSSDTSVRLEVGSNYIEITPEGVRVVGTRIDFN